MSDIQNTTGTLFCVEKSDWAWFCLYLYEHGQIWIRDWAAGGDLVVWMWNATTSLTFSLDLSRSVLTETRTNYSFQWAKPLYLPGLANTIQFGPLSGESYLLDLLTLNSSTQLRCSSSDDDDQPINSSSRFLIPLSDLSDISLELVDQDTAVGQCWKSFCDSRLFESCLLKPRHWPVDLYLLELQCQPPLSLPLQTLYP